MVNYFLRKGSKFYVVRTIGFCSNSTCVWSKYLSNSVWKDFRLPISASAMIIVSLRFVTLDATATWIPFKNPSTVTNPTIEPYCVLLSLALPCRTTWQIANSKLFNVKIPERKINFCSKFAVKLFPATVANADIVSLKSLHTLFDKYLDHMLWIWTKLYGPNYTKYWAFWQSVDAIL